MASDPKPGPLFFSYAQEGIRVMARAGMNDHQIACVLCSVRAGALLDERARIAALAERDAPAIGIRSQDMEAEMLARCIGTLAHARAERNDPPRPTEEQQ